MRAVILALSVFLCSSCATASMQCKLPNITMDMRMGAPDLGFEFPATEQWSHRWSRLGPDYSWSRPGPHHNRAYFIKSCLLDATISYSCLEGAALEVNASNVNDPSSIVAHTLGQIKLDRDIGYGRSRARIDVKSTATCGDNPLRVEVKARGNRHTFARAFTTFESFVAAVRD